MHEPYPLTFEPILKEKVWGGTRLAGLGKPVEAGTLYGESWEIADLRETSSSGGGGGSAFSVIASGPMAGRTIRDAVKLWGGRLLGQTGLIAARQFGHRGDPAFPLLIKFLDASEHLSVQTHPSPEYASKNPSAHLKTESWYVLDAEASTLADGTPVDPTLFVGTKPGVTPTAFRGRLNDGTAIEALATAPAVPGECWTLPSGTVHALGGGVLVAEVQTPSDTTFRVYDWQREYGRPDRALHIDEAMASIDFEGGIGAAPRHSGFGRVASTKYYTIDRVDPGAGAALAREACVVLIGVEGEGEVDFARAGASAVRVPIRRGTTVLVPAACSAGSTVRGGEGFGVLSVRIGTG